MIGFPAYPNQGHKIVLGWDNAVNLKNWTAYIGTDGQPFLPPNDRNGYTDGTPRRLPTGAILETGHPISRLTFPWMSYGQIDYLDSTFNRQFATASIHKPNSLDKDTLSIYNAVLNLDLSQATNLTRKRNGYEGVVVELVLWELLS